VAVLSLALGIGANTAIFSLIHTLMLRRLPVREPDQLVEFLNQYPGDPALNVFSWQSYEYFRDHNHVFSGLTGLQPNRFHVRGEGLEPETVEGEVAVGNFFEVLGVKPAIGRLIGPGDDRMGAAGSAVAVVSWSYWKNKFNLDPAIVGRRIMVEDMGGGSHTARVLRCAGRGAAGHLAAAGRRTRKGREACPTIDRAVAARYFDRAGARGNGGAIPVDFRRANQGQHRSRDAPVEV